MEYLKKYTEFVNGLSEDELDSISNAYTNILYSKSSDEFYTLSRDVANHSGIVVFDSDGMADVDVLLTAEETRNFIVGQGDFDLEIVRHAD